MSLAVFAVVALLAGAGHGLLRSAGFRCSSGPAWFGHAFLAGAALLTVVVSLAGLFEAAHLWVSVPALGLAVLLPIALRRPGSVEAIQGWSTFLPAVLLVALCGWLAAQRPVWNVDAQMRWVQHAQWLAETGSLTPSRMVDASWAALHPSYPPLVPAVVGLAIQLGADADTGVRGLFPFFLLALLGVLHGYAVRIAGSKAALAVTTAFGLTPCLSWLPARDPAFGLGADAALADLPLAAALAAIGTLLVEILRRPQGAQHFALLVLAAAAALTKQEGAVIAPLMALTTMAWSWRVCEPPARALALRAAALALLASVVAYGGWRAIAWGMPVAEGESYLSSAGIAALFDGLDRLPTIARAFFDEVTELRTWGLLWVVPSVWLASRLLRRDEGVSVLPALWLALATAVATAGYLASGWRDGDYALLMDVSATRLLIQASPFAAMLACHLPRLWGSTGAGAAARP